MRKQSRNLNVKHMIFMYELNANKTVTYFYVSVDIASAGARRRFSLLPVVRTRLPSSRVVSCRAGEMYEATS
jgi:hypothetical protein